MEKDFRKLKTVDAKLRRTEEHRVLRLKFGAPAFLRFVGNNVEFLPLDNAGTPAVEKVELASGKTILGSVIAVDPVTDIAVLGPPDDQTFYEENELFIEALNSNTFVPLAADREQVVSFHRG